MNVAYGRRNIFLIKLRRVIYLIYIVSKKILASIKGYNGNIQVKKIIVYPPILEQNRLSDLLNKFLMGFPYKENLQIDVPLSKIHIDGDIFQLGTPQHQRRYLDSKSSHINFIDSPKIIFSRYDKIFIWKKTSCLNPKILFNLEKVEIIDKTFYSIIESRVWKDGYYSTFSEKEKIAFQLESINNYQKLEKKHISCDKSYCFLTGPTFNDYEKYTFDDNSLKIICNSIVINKEFLEYIKGPDIITFSDPSFHFSACTYASEFRDHVQKVVERYNSFIIVPEETIPLMLYHFPKLKDNIIGIGLTDHFNFPSSDNLKAHMSKRKGNSIITLFMIPIASSLSYKIFFLGADGRAKKESYFWKHNKTVQLNDLMESVFFTHPSFFRDHEYASYYSRHCELIENQFKYGESQNKEYHSLTRSYIPALKTRFTATQN